MKVTERSRLLRRNKRGESQVGSFRARLDWRWLRRRLAARGVADSDLDDVAQEVLVAMSQAGPAPPLWPGQTVQQQRRALMSCFVRWEVWTYFRAKRRQRAEPRAEIEKLAVTVPEEEERLDEQACCGVLLEALEALLAKEPALYALVEAHDLQEIPMVRIAARLGIAQGTAWTRWRKGRSELAAFVQQHAAKRWPGGRR